MTDGPVSRGPRRARASSTSRRKRQWPKSPAPGLGTTAEPDYGLTVTCDGHRIFQAAEHPDDPNALLLWGLGFGVTSGGKLWNHLKKRNKSDGPQAVACSKHGKHVVLMPAIAKQLELLAPRPGRNWPVVPVSQVLRS